MLLNVGEDKETDIHINKSFRLLLRSNCFAIAWLVVTVLPATWNLSDLIFARLLPKRRIPGIKYSSHNITHHCPIPGDDVRGGSNGTHETDSPTRKTTDFSHIHSPFQRQQLFQIAAVRGV